MEILLAWGIAETILSYVAFPCLWCLMAVTYRLPKCQNRTAFTLSVAITHLLFCTGVMLFLLPSNVTRHIGYALLYLDGVLTQPYDHVEQLLILEQFLAVWLILPLYGIGTKQKHENQPERTAV